METIHLTAVTPANPDLKAMIQSLDEDLLQRYPAELIYGIDFEDPQINEVVFIVAYCGERPVGCGAIRPINKGTTELKRFFVAGEFRRQGIAQQILNTLENKAIELNFKSIKLETGAKQFEAIHFYKKHGYVEIDRFGPYVDCQESLCYEKQLN